MTSLKDGRQKYILKDYFEFPLFKVNSQFIMPCIKSIDMVTHGLEDKYDQYTLEWVGDV